MSEAWENPRRWAQHMRKTEICRFWRNGECQRGDRCKYAHGEDELQQRGTHLSTTQVSELISEWEEGKGGGKGRRVLAPLFVTPPALALTHQG